MKKKAICIIIVLMLFIIPSYDAYADAGTIAITGGSIAVGGAGTIATGAIAGPVVVAVFCGMMAMGMNIELTQASQEAGMTKTQFLKSKLEQYCREASITYGVFNNAITDGTTILQNGVIKLGSKAGTQIKQFCNWLFNSNQVVNVNASADSITLGQYTLPFGRVFSFTNSSNNVVRIESNVPVAWCATTGSESNTYTPICITSATESVTLQCYINDAPFGSQGGVYTNNGYSRYYIPEIEVSNLELLGLTLINNIPSFFGSLDGTFNPPYDFTNDSFTGDKSGYDNQSGLLNPDNDKSTVINPGLIGQIPIPADKDVTVNVRDYLDALEKVLDGIQAGIIARDKETDIPFTIPIPDEAVIDPTIDKEDDQDLPDQDDQTPVTDPDKPVDPEQNPSTSVEPLKFDLKNIFPFCIPFDIKDMLAKLNAEPVAPNYHVDWNIPLLNTSLEFDINLSCWNSVAAILRKMELLSFIVGLAVLTRNLIRG